MIYKVREKINGISSWLCLLPRVVGNKGTEQAKRKEDNTEEKRKQPRAVKRDIQERRLF